MVMMLMCQLGLIGTARYRVMMMMMVMMMIVVVVGTSGSDGGSGVLMIGIVPKGVHLSLVMLFR